MLYILIQNNATNLCMIITNLIQYFYLFTTPQYNIIVSLNNDPIYILIIIANGINKHISIE